MDTVVGQTAIGEILFKFAYRVCYIYRLVMEDHCDDVIRGMIVIFSEITALVYEDAELAQTCVLLAKK